MALNFAACSLGAAPASKRVVNLVDLGVNVFGLDEIKDSKLPIVGIVSTPLFPNVEVGA